MKVTAQDIESARREYVAALGTKHEANKRQLLRWLIMKARIEHEEHAQ
jgi:hypothetical protein